MSRCAQESFINTPLRTYGFRLKLNNWLCSLLHYVFHIARSTGKQMGYDIDSDLERCGEVEMNGPKLNTHFWNARNRFWKTQAME